VRILGEPAWRNPEIYHRIAIVQEREAVYDVLTGYEFVRLSARLQRLADPDAAARRAIERVEMGPAQGRKTGGYSKGMKQRIKIAAAIVHDPEVLLLDEPFNGADPHQRLQMMDMLRTMAAEGRTILFSSHILEEMEQLGENILVIVAGRLAASGDFRAIRRLLTDRPHTFVLRSPEPRRLAGALLADDCVQGVEVDGDQLSVRTSDFGRFAQHVPRVARDQRITLTELYPADDTIESVFTYLAERR
jgi:ABC-2 type transport system ATP-binding protein